MAESLAASSGGTDPTQIKLAKFKPRPSNADFLKKDPISNSGIFIPGTDEAHNFGTILAWAAPESMKKDFYYEICGKTLVGCPVMTIQLGQWDFRKINSSSMREDWSKYVDLMFARLDAKMKKNAKLLAGTKDATEIHQAIAVIDFDKFGMSQILSVAGITNIRSMVRRYESTYAGTFKSCYVVNASPVFKMLCNMLKPMLSSDTLGSLAIFGTNQNEWRQTLLSTIPEDQLPFRLGGTLVPAGTHTVDYKHLIYGRRYSIFAEATLDHDEEED